MDVAQASVAGRWFALRVHYAPSRWRRITWVPKMLLLYALSLGFYLAPFKERGTVLLVRRSDGRILKRMEYDEPAEMEFWVQDLARSLVEQHVFDLCRDLDLDIHLAEGAGGHYDGTELVTRTRTPAGAEGPVGAPWPPR